MSGFVGIGHIWHDLRPSAAGFLPAVCRLPSGIRGESGRDGRAACLMISGAYETSVRFYNRNWTEVFYPQIGEMEFSPERYKINARME